MIFWKSWKKYWFSSESLFNLAICRLIIVGFQIYWLLNNENKYVLMVAEKASVIAETLYSPPLVFRLLTLPFGEGFLPSIWLIETIAWLTVVAGILSFLGWWTNPSLMLFTFGSVFLTAYRYSFSEFHHAQGLMMIALTIMALSPCGRVLSIDDIRRRFSLAGQKKQFQKFNILEEKSEFARWPLLLIQWLLALCYFSAWLSKYRYSGIDWANGFTLQYYLIQDGLRWEAALPLWLAQFHTFLWVLQWIVEFFQLTFFLCVIFPVFCWLYLPLGLVFHTSIFIIMKAPFFHWVVMYSTFIKWDAVFLALGKRIKFLKSSDKLEVLYDGHCPMCIRSMTFLRYFDWYDRITYSDVTVRWPSLSAQRDIGFSLSDALREMYLLLPDGSVRKGFFAFREMMWRMPLLWPFLVIFYVPMAETIGPKIYHFVARRRLRIERCTHETCSIDDRGKDAAG